MNEKLLQFIWLYQYYHASDLRSISGESIEVVHPGQLNNNQGPDFLNARIRVDGMLLVGSVELHLKTSLWRLHGHEPDPFYRNVILHVVLDHDQELVHSIPTLDLKGRI